MGHMYIHIFLSHNKILFENDSFSEDIINTISYLFINKFIFKYCIILNKYKYSIIFLVIHFYVI